MALKFFNIRSKEVVVADGPRMAEKIAALWASSDHSPNITQGQDMGWRLAPEVVVEMKRIKQNYPLILDIAKRFNLLPEDVDEPKILAYISQKTLDADAPIAQDHDYIDEYNEEIRRLEREHEPKVEQLPVVPLAQTVTTTQKPEPTTTTTTTQKPVESTTTTTTTTEKPVETATTTTAKK